MNRNRPQEERRQWARLPLAIPVFVRSRDKSGKELLEFATALNISAAGALIAVRRSLPLSSQVLLEIPSVPLASTTVLPKSCRNLRARAVWISHAATYQLVGLRFSHPLLGRKSPPASTRRKLVSSL
ncbi:MAG: PilZ domain-containing protein [Terriglobales bacterium]